MAERDPSDMVRVRYNYQVDGISYEGSRIVVLEDTGWWVVEDRPGGGLKISRRQGRGKRVTEQYFVGKKATVFYHPRRPARALLDPTPSFRGIEVMILPAGILLGLFGLACGLWLLPTGLKPK